MALYSQPKPPYPDAWKIFGHSWGQGSTGPSGDQSGRIDRQFAASMDIESGNFRNYCMSGARASFGGTNGRAQGGWARVMNYLIPPVRVGPYAPDGGATLLMFGINDLGTYGGHLTNVRQTLVDALEAMISRARSSRLYLTTDAALAYGASWTSSAAGSDLSTSGTLRTATVTATSTITFTLPADYKGEPVAWGFLKRPDATGGTVTFSGTAGASGTLYTGGGQPGAFVEHGYIIKRFTAFTSANAGQTIIATATSYDGGGTMFFDSIWLESLTPPPVIVCNVARLTATGYGNSFYTNWTGTEAAKDGDVNTVNGLITTMVGRFDSMVQIADVDTAISKDANKTSDGIHPNEFGAGPVVDAIVAARDRLQPPGSAFGNVLSYNGPAYRTGTIRRPRIATYYQGPDDVTYSTYTPVAGHMFAIPFAVSESREVFSHLALEVTTVGSTASTIRWAIYDDVEWRGYPQQSIVGQDPSIAGAISIATTPAAPSVRSSALNGGLSFFTDPGTLYWMVLKVETVGTSQVWRSIAGQSRYMPNRPTAGTGTALNCAWQLTGQSTGVLPGTFPSGAALATAAPLLQLLKFR